jgi:ParB-like chromosome segregation protein Spo0J
VAVEYVDPGTLRPAPYNPRRIEPEALKRLAALLDAHGFVDPVIARREDRLVIGGHQRLKANSLRKRPDQRVPVVFLAGLSDEQAKALNIALNNPAAQGEYDQPMLAALLKELATADLDLADLTAFGPDDIARLTGQAAPAIDDGQDTDIPELFQVIVECEDERCQRELFERLEAEGLKCRLLTL